MKSQEMNKQPQPKKEEEKHSGHSKTMPQKRRVHPSTLINNPKIPVQQSTAIGFMVDHFTDKKEPLGFTKEPLAFTKEPLAFTDKKEPLAFTDRKTDKLNFPDKRINDNFGVLRKDGGFI